MHPFHRILRWDGKCFHRSSLDKAGVTLNLGHNGGLCPAYSSKVHPTEDPPKVPSAEDPQELYSSSPIPKPDATSKMDPTDAGDDSNNKDEEEAEEEDSETEALWRNVETGGIPLKGVRKDKPRLDSDQCPILTIVDITGIHELRTRFCRCSPLDSNPLSHQLLSMGLFPSSMKNPKTAFTFRVLDDLDLTNLEGKISTFKYFKKLRRLTSNAFPHMITDRYRELMRVLRQWRDMRSRLHAGVLYLPEGTTLTEGDLGLFCAACPQPGVNLPTDWEKDPMK